MQWNLEELQRLVDNETHEHSSLEFKASDALLTHKEQLAKGIPQQHLKSKDIEVSIDVSAMANANGGHIIYGITENNDNRAEAIDLGHPPTTKKIAWLEQIFATKIKPPLNGIQIYAIPLSNSTHEVYVLKVPAATSDAPHQASDKCYYQRINSQNIQLEDYQIRDLMRRDIAPDLFLNFRFTNDAWEYPAPPAPPSFRCTLDIAVDNRSHTPAMYSVFFMFIDSRLSLEGNINWIKTENFRQENGVIFLLYHYNVTPLNSVPFFKGCPFTILHCNVRYHALPNDTGSLQFPISWEIHTPGTDKRIVNGTLTTPPMERPFLE